MDKREPASLSSSFDKSILIAFIPIILGAGSGYFFGPMVSKLPILTRFICAFLFFVGLGYFATCFNFLFFSRKIKRLSDPDVVIVSAYIHATKKHGPIIIGHIGIILSALIFCTGYIFGNNVVALASLGIWWFSEKHLADIIEIRFISREIALRAASEEPTTKGVASN